MSSYTLDYAFKAWAKVHPPEKLAVDFERKLSMALRFYVFPELDPESPKLKPKQLEQYAQSLDLEKLKRAVAIFDRHTEAAMADGKLSPRTRANYRSVLVQFVNWMEEQVWWRELSFDLKTDVAPFRVKLDEKLTQKQPPSYGLKRNEVSETLDQEIKDFLQFRVSGEKNLRKSRREQRRAEGNEGRSRPKLDMAKPSTFKKEEEIILRFLGWYRSYYPENENDLSINVLTDIQTLDDFTYWAVTHRGVSYSTGLHAVATGIAIAKWANYAQCNRRNWSDIPLILDLQDLQNEYSEIYKQEKQKKQSAKWAKKELSHEDARKVVQYLHLLCAPGYGKHDPDTGEFLKHGNRPDSAIVRAWQVYIITKFLVYCPVRQEEIRQLELGKTLFRHLDKESNPYYIVRIKEHKRSYLGKDRHYQLPNFLTADLDLWIYKWRPLMEKSIQTLEGWMNFWGRPFDKVERMEERLEAARQGIVSDKVKQSVEDYIQQEEIRLQGALNRHDAWEEAKNNLNSHNYLFFMMAKGEAVSFGQPHTVTSVWTIVKQAIAQATTALFEETKWTNPHALRHIAEKHIRLLNKSDALESFGTLIGHSKEMGDEYAAQITTDYELSQKVVDDWWL